MPTLEDLAPEPTSDDATAATLTRYELATAVGATACFFTTESPSGIAQLAAIVSGSFNTAYLLMELAKADPAAADAAARAVCGFIEDPQVAHELAWEWLAGMGVDPEAVAAAAVSDQAAHVAKRTAATS